MFKGSKPAQRYVPGRVPGAPLPGAAEDKKKKGRNKRSNRENGEANGVVRGEDGELNGNGDGDGAAALVEGMTALVTKEEDEAVQKKLRGLFRKVCSALQ